MLCGEQVLFDVETEWIANCKNLEELDNFDSNLGKSENLD